MFVEHLPALHSDTDLTSGQQSETRRQWRVCKKLIPLLLGLIVDTCSRGVAYLRQQILTEKSSGRINRGKGL